MSIRHAVLLAGALSCLAITLPASDALAQQKQNVSFKVPAENTKVTQHIIDVGDAPNHTVNVYEAHTTFTNNAPVINGIALHDLWSRGFGDLTDGNGVVTSYLVYVMENGDKIFARAMNVTQTGAAGMLTGTVVGHITGGTGKLEGIQGIVRQVVSFNLKERSGGSQNDIDYAIGR